MKTLARNICKNIYTQIKESENKICAMWYLVNLPGNKLNIAVKTEKNSIAADCLNKVSSNCFRNGSFATYTLIPSIR